MSDDVEFLGFNAPTALAAELRRQAARRMSNQSSILREALAKELGMWPLAMPENATIVAQAAGDERPSASG